MQNPNCIFCRIILKQAPSTIITETENVLVINNIAPQAPVHYLIMPKKHIENISALDQNDACYSVEMLTIARDLGNNVPSKSFNLISNNGSAAGQSVFHLHFHFLSGKNLYDGGLKL